MNGRYHKYSCGLVRLAVVVMAIAVTVGCERGTPSSPSANASINIPAELAYCADEVNRYRASIGRGRLARSQALEDFAAQSAENDGRAYIAHHHFTMTNGAGTSAAETEILWWRGYAVRTVIQQGLAQMWQSGPSGAHYDVLVGPYTQVGCGIFINGNEVTIAQDFR